MSVTCPMWLVRELATPLREGDRVIVHAKPSFSFGRGTLSLRADGSARSHRRVARPDRAAAQAAGRRRPVLARAETADFPFCRKASA